MVGESAGVGLSLGVGASLGAGVSVGEGLSLGVDESLGVGLSVGEGLSLGVGSAVGVAVGSGDVSANAAGALPRTIEINNARGTTNARSFLVAVPKPNPERRDMPVSLPLHGDAAVPRVPYS
jgi:hypothetical protein